MEELMQALEKAYADYREDLDASIRKSRPTDGLLGFGRSLRDDACHDRFDERLADLTAQMLALEPKSAQAEAIVRILLFPRERDWPLSAQWMLRAAERHALPFLKDLTNEAASAFLTEYTRRYRPWDRLPVQKEIVRALKEQA